MKSLFKKSSQRGYSLIELSIALAIVGVVIAGSIIGVQAILRSNNVNKTIVQTNTAIGKIIAKLVRDADYTNANTVNLSKAGMEVWAATDIISGGTSNVQVTHPLSGRLYVEKFNGTPSSYGIIDGQGLVYTLSSVPVAACSDLAVGLEGLAYAMTITNQDSISVAPKQLDDAKSVKTPSKKFDSSVANTLCTGAGTDGVVPTSASTQATISFLVPRR